VVKNAKALADGLTKRGIRLVSGGTDNHLMLVDLTNTGKTGKEVETALDAVGITANKNTIPNDPQSPFITSGLRLGTPAATTRGLKEADFDVVADVIAKTILEGDAQSEACRKLVETLTARYPLS
jgi:glycine hydroxymethyltransferase